MQKQLRYRRLLSLSPRPLIDASIDRISHLKCLHDSENRIAAHRVVTNVYSNAPVRSLIA